MSIIKKISGILFICFLASNFAGCAVALVGAAAGVATIEKSEGNNQPSNEQVEVAPPSNSDLPQKEALPSASSTENILKANEQLSSNKESSPPDKPASKQAFVAPYANNTSINNLTSHSWKISAINQSGEANFNFEDSVFGFSKDSSFKALLSCKFISGQFHSEDHGHFLIKKLNSSNKQCNYSKKRDVLIMSKLLMADEFFIDHQTLILKANGIGLMSFIEAEKQINIKEFKKIKK